MNTPSLSRLGLVLVVLANVLSGCSEPVKETPAAPVAPTPQLAMQNAKDAYQRKDYAQAADWFRKAADLGDIKGQYNLGLFYSEGKGVPQDYAQAANWYRKAADQGLSQAQLSLGQLYQQGQGVPQDYAQAANWYRKAADQGNTDAQAALKSLSQTAKKTKSKSNAKPAQSQKPKS